MEGGEQFRKKTGQVIAPLGRVIYYQMCVWGVYGVGVGLGYIFIWVTKILMAPPQSHQIFFPTPHPHRDD